MLLSLLLVLCLAGFVAAAPTTSYPVSALSTNSISYSVSTAVPSAQPSAVLNLSSNPLPPEQPTCPSSEPYCPGRLLQTIQLAQIYSDQKTFVDKPGRFNSSTINANFEALINSTANLTVGDIEKFVEGNFLGEGLDIEPAPIDNFTTTPEFLTTISDPIVRGFAQAVHAIWPSLTCVSRDPVGLTHAAVATYRT